MHDTRPSGVLAPPVGYACLYEPPAPAGAGDGAGRTHGRLVAVAQEFSPRYEQHRDDLVTIDISGLERLMRPRGGEAIAGLAVWRTIGEELRREAAVRGLCVHVALASTRTAAIVLACARPGLTVVDAGCEPAALAPLPIRVARHALPEAASKSAFQRQTGRAATDDRVESTLHTIEHWGVRTLGDLAALPPDSLVARLGRDGQVWRALARGEDIQPLVPTPPEERFESSLDLEWPIEGLEPLSFVLTRLLEPLSIRLERRDCGAAELHVALRLATREVYERRLRLPSPMRDVRTLRTLALLDLESHPPPAAIERVTVSIEPTPGRVIQHTLFARPYPTPEQLSTLLARLTALMGSDRVGAAQKVDSHRPGAFAMKPFATDHHSLPEGESLRSGPRPLVSALRRCRQPVPIGVIVDEGNAPAQVIGNRRGFKGGAVVGCAGPWRTSGEWWLPRDQTSTSEAQPAEAGRRGERAQAGASAWNREEWDVGLSDGAVYRVFRDCSTDAWFVDAIVD